MKPRTGTSFAVQGVVSNLAIALHIRHHIMTAKRNLLDEGIV